MNNDHIFTDKELMENTVSLVSKTGFNPREMAYHLVAVFDRGIWKEVTPKNGVNKREFVSFADWVESSAPWGLNIPWEYIKPIISKYEPNGFKEILRSMPGVSENGTNRYSRLGIPQPKHTGSNEPSYQLARLKRDRPELAEKVISGELTPNAAFIEAGFANKKMTVPLIKEKVVGWILKYFNEDDIEYIKNNL